MPNSKGLKRPPGDSGLGEQKAVKICRSPAVDSDLKDCWWCGHPIKESESPLQPIVESNRFGPKFFHHNCYEAYQKHVGAFQ